MAYGARVPADLAPSCCLAATVRGVQIRVICSQPSSVGAEPGARSHAGYGQVSARLGFAYPGRPVVWIGSDTDCSPDLPGRVTVAWSPDTTHARRHER